LEEVPKKAASILLAGILELKQGKWGKGSIITANTIVGSKPNAVTCVLQNTLHGIFRQTVFLPKVK
jgi:hypothetical protein